MTTPHPSLTALVRRASGMWPTGVAVLVGGGERITVSTLQCVSCEPPWVSVAIDRASRRGQAVIAAGAFDARLLTVAERALARDAEAPWPDAPALVEFTCAIRRVEPVGDHDLVLAEVTTARVGEGEPLVYWRRAFFAVRRDYPWLASSGHFRAFVQAWEDGSLPKADWTHAAHVGVGAAYAVRHRADALAHLRDGIRRYNAAVGTPNTDTSGYHETLTRYWADAVGELVAGLDDEWQAACLAVDRLGEDRDRHTLHYGVDVVRSVAARRHWVAPDLGGPLTPPAPAR